MRQINLDTWERRDHFKQFSTWDYPHFNLCANVDVTAFFPAVKQRDLSFTVATLFVLARTANAIREFRYRIRGATVIEHEIVHPGTTILRDGNLFTFCTVDYAEDFGVFAARAAEQIAYVRAHPSIENEPRDDLLYSTSIPWVSFTSVMHPLKFPVDSVPRFAWGKCFEDGSSIKMPLSVQAHHALMDGVHVGQFFTDIQVYLYNPDSFLVDN
ncbi:MAG: chloramphenicol acetyltransferase [Anaerolineae bacterium]|nr:chloramphenicol acetyltransferase [Anaerolineae bacterium]